MSTRSTTSHTRPPTKRSTAPPSQSSSIISNPSSRSATPTRVHAPRHRGQHSTSSSNMPSAVPPANPSPPSTPTGRKRNTGRRRADARKPLPTDGSDEAETPDEDLMELLGMTSSAKTLPQEKGILSISKTEIDAARAKTATPKKTRAPKRSEATIAHNAETPASSDLEAPRRSRRTKKANGNNAGADQDDSTAQNATRRKTKPVRAPVSRDDSPGPSFDVSNLSKSLPPSFFAENAKNDSGETGWDMPTEATGGQPLNWQQQLVAGDKDSTSRRSQRLAAANGNGGRKPKNQAKAGGHNRHSSHEQTPTSNLTTMMKAVDEASNVPVSAFDNSIPFHTGFNVHRAPQTPIRHSGNRSSPDSSNPTGAISLPIVGEFPRLNKAGGMPLGVSKYAGPTFHNSPASGSLPAPDLDDF